MPRRLSACWPGLLLLVPVAAGILAADDLAPVSERAKRVHAPGMLFDGHDDLPWRLQAADDMRFDKLDISKRLPSGRLVPC